MTRSARPSAPRGTSLRARCASTSFCCSFPAGGGRRDSLRRSNSRWRSLAAEREGHKWAQLPPPHSVSGAAPSGRTARSTPARAGRTARRRLRQRNGGPAQGRARHPVSGEGEVPPLRSIRRAAAGHLRSQAIHLGPPHRAQGDAPLSRLRPQRSRAPAPAPDATPRPPAGPRRRHRLATVSRYVATGAQGRSGPSERSVRQRTEHKKGSRWRAKRPRETNVVASHRTCPELGTPDCAATQGHWPAAGA